MGQSLRVSRPPGSLAAGLQPVVDGLFGVASQRMMGGEQFGYGGADAESALSFELRDAAVQVLSLRLEQRLIGGIAQQGVAEFERGRWYLASLKQDAGSFERGEGGNQLLLIDIEE